MQLKDRLRRGLQHTRRCTGRVLSEIVKAQDWVRRPAPDANHALWIAGHLGAATNAFIGLVDLTKKHQREDFGPLFRPDGSPDLRQEISEYVSLVRQVMADDAPLLPDHPVFGRTTKDEWRQFHAWHAAHHFSFLIPNEPRFSSQGTTA